MRLTVVRSVVLLLLTALLPSAAWAGVEGVWFKGPRMPSARQEISTAVLNGEIYVIAGYDRAGASTDIVEVFNPDTGEWRSAAPLPINNNHGAAATAAGTLYAFGGLSTLAFASDPEQDGE